MKKIILGLIISIILVSMIVSVNAQQIQDTTYAPSNVPFSLSSWFSHTFGGNTFSVVGDSNSCGASHEPNNQFTISGATCWKYNQGVCGGSELVDVFFNDFSHPWLEFNSDRVTPTSSICCSSGNNCIFQEYCCPSAQPESQSDCSSGTYTSVSCPAWSYGYRCKSTDLIPYKYSSFSYCASTSNPICWIRNNGVCTSTTQWSGSCPSSTSGLPVFTSQPACISGTNAGGTCEGVQGGTCSNQCGSGFVNAGQFDCVGSANECCVPGNGGGNNNGNNNSNSGCTPNWQTGTWSACNSNTNMEYRPVNDTANCGTSVGMPQSTQSCNGGNNNSVCTQEVKQCSDGSYVGRDANNNCAFKDCPTKSFDINAEVFKIGTFSVTWLMLIIGLVLIIVLVSLSGGKRR